MESKKRQILQWSILGGILVIVVTVMLCVSFSRIKREGIQNYEDVMTSSASKYAQKVNMELSELQTAADVAADVLSTSSHYGQNFSYRKPWFLTVRQAVQNMAPFSDLLLQSLFRPIHILYFHHYNTLLFLRLYFPAPP